MKKNLGVFTLYIILTVIMTYPVTFKMSNHIPNDLGDPLYETWIIAWNIKSFQNGFRDYWDANIFHPHKKTLAYSERATGVAILGFPVMLITKNIIFTYNFLFLVSFILSGFFMFLLVKELTGDLRASIISGVIFTFLPFRFGHVAHLTNLTMEWMPLTILFLHRFIKKNDYKNLILFSLFYILQVLCCLYNGLYLTIIVFFYLMYYGYRQKILFNLSFVKKIFFFCLSCSIILIPSVLPYLFLEKTSVHITNLENLLSYSADLYSYFSVPPSNVFYNKLGDFFHKRNIFLFTGITPLVLVLTCFIKKADEKGQKKYIPFKNEVLFFGSMGFWGILLSLGPLIYIFNKEIIMPFGILHKFVPGFKHFRQISDFGLITLFSLSVLCGIGMKNILDNRFYCSNSKTIILTTLFLILFEYASFPLNTPEIKTNKQIPEVYKWLSKQKTSFNIVELPVYTNPLEWWKEARYLYYSTYHWKRTLNGAGSFFPNEFEWLRGLLNFELINSNTIDILSLFKINYVIIHFLDYNKDIRNAIKKSFNAYPSKLKLIKQFREDCIYELNPDNIADDRITKKLVSYLYTSEEKRIKIKKENLNEFKCLFYFNEPIIAFERKYNHNSIYKNYGWSEDENWGCWSTGLQSSLMLYFPSKHPGKMTVVWAPPPNNEKLSQEVNIYINNIHSGKYTFVSKSHWNVEKHCWNFEKYEINMDRKIFNNSVNEIRFNYKYSQRAGQRDSRNISVGFKKIEFSY